MTARDAAVLAGGLLATAVTVALLRLVPNVDPTTVGLTLLLVVLATATFGKRRAAITVAVVATLAFNYFFFAPVGTLVIAEPHNWIALLAFLAVAIIASNLSAHAQARALEVARQREAAELARQRADLASTLLASLSHDLKTPLTAIRVAVDNLREPLPDDARAAQAAAATVELVRLTRLFENILDMARIDAAAIHVERQWVTPADVVDAALAHARPALDGRGLALDAECGVAVQIDPRAASAAVAHLLENAARYSPPGQKIAVAAEADESGLRVSVVDAGPGLEPDELDRVFERFFRGRRARATTSGTGMGLAIARGLLSAAGGRIWAENVPSGGARFTIVVPGPTRALVAQET